MGLFQKKPQTSSSAPLYTLGLQKSVLIVGLGNVGKKYDLTRHNIGFACAEHIVQALDLSTWITKKDLKCNLATGKAGDKRIIVMEPTTMMNLSGEAVRAVMQFYKIPSTDMIVIHDEMDIPFGQIRTRVGGGSAGHNGIKSLIQHLGEDFGRIRVGVGSSDILDAADYVLAKFSKQEQSSLPELVREVTAITTEFAYGNTLPIETRKFLDL